MSISRFYLADLPASGTVSIDDAEGHHAANVLRVKTGDELRAFDGRGNEAVLRVQQVKRKEVLCSVESHAWVDRELPARLIVGLGLPKGDRQRFIIEKLVELGVTKLVPLITDRGVAQPTDSALSRLERVVVEACKQCGRNQLMEIAEPQSCISWWTTVSDEKLNIRWIAHPYHLETADSNNSAANGSSKTPAGSDGNTISFSDITSPGIGIAIGPEGGFTDREVEQAIAAAWSQVNLGPRILRVETAAMMLSVLAAQKIQPWNF